MLLLGLCDCIRVALLLFHKFIILCIETIAKVQFVGIFGNADDVTAHSKLFEKFHKKFIAIMYVVDECPVKLLLHNDVWYVVKFK